MQAGREGAPASARRSEAGCRLRACLPPALRTPRTHLLAGAVPCVGLPLALLCQRLGLVGWRALLPGAAAAAAAACGLASARHAADFSKLLM